MKAFKSLGVAAVLMLAMLAGAQDQSNVKEQVADAVKIYRSGDVTGAKDKFLTLYESHPDDVDVLSWLGFIHLRSEEYDKAAPLLAKAVEMKPNDLELRNNLGNAYHHTKQYDKALEQYYVITEHKPNMFEPWYNVGNVHMVKGEWQKAIDAYVRANQLKGDDPFVLNNLGYCEERIDKHAAAAGHFAQASDLRTDNRMFAKNAAYSYLKIKDHKKALPYLERSYRMGAETDKVLIENLGATYVLVGKKSDALFLYQRHEDLLKDDATYWFNLGYLRGTSDVRGAEMAYRRAHELDPNNMDVLQNLGAILYNRGSYAEAATMFDRWAGLAPESVEAKKNLASAMAKTGNIPRAQQLWAEILRAEPNNHQVRLNLARVLSESENKGDRDRAATMYEEVLKHQPRNATALNGVGLHYLQQERYQEAESAFRKAVNSDPKLVPAYNNQAVALERMGRRKDAIAVLEKAAKIDPNAEEVKINLNRLKRAK